ncbi:MAG: hypothetical protein P8Y42_23010 [Exilibacterium sp.]
MKAFLTLLKWDFILQYRQKLWFAAAVVTAVYIAILVFVPQEYASIWISALLFAEICTLGLMLMAGNVFLEQGINQFFVPMAIAMAITSVPIVWHLDIFAHPALWLIPSHPAMIVLSGCLRDMPTGQFYTAAGVLTLWILAEFYLSTRFFHRYVSERQRT